MSASTRGRNRPLVVSIFCGGRGGSQIIKEFLRRSEVELYALINAYDDGLSTGELRHFIPGMLGPSDVRKNLANFLHWHSKYQYALTRLLEFRLSADDPAEQVRRLQEWVASRHTAVAPGLAEPLRTVLAELDQTSPRVKGYLAAFFAYQTEQDHAFRFDDCSIGNLIFAGAYLQNKRNFNAAAAALARDFDSKVRLLNVTRGENRILVALKEDGTLLEREAKITGPQSDAKICDLFLLELPLSEAELLDLAAQATLEAKRAFLQARAHPVALAPEAERALLDSDIIIYGPGTQFSSLQPSYQTEGIGAAIRASRARLKIFVSNIHGDHDIAGYSAAELVRETLRRLGGSAKDGVTLTHVLCTTRSRQPEKLWPAGERATPAAGPAWIEGDFENPTRPGVHSGFLTVRSILNAYEVALVPAALQLDIYINLYQRSLAVQQLIDEFLELPWQDHFQRVRLRFNQAELPPLQLPEHLVIESVNRTELFSEVHELSEWASARDSKYLATLSGDGAYRLCDILNGMEILTRHSFAAVHGSRNQSHQQFFSSLDAAYGESPLLYAASLAAGFLFSFLFVIRFGLVFSDPLTGFRIYHRSALAGVLDQVARLPSDSSSGITKILLQNRCEIAEIPVSYRTFRGFTRARWRIFRSFRNAWHLFF